MYLVEKPANIYIWGLIFQSKVVYHHFIQLSIQTRDFIYFLDLVCLILLPIQVFPLWFLFFLYMRDEQWDGLSVWTCLYIIVWIQLI